MNDESENLVSESFYDQILFKPEIKSIYSVNDNDKIILGAGLKHESLKRTYFDIGPTVVPQQQGNYIGQNIFNNNPSNNRRDGNGQQHLTNGKHAFHSNYRML